LLYDNFGSLKTAASYFGAMRDAGIEVASFRAERDGVVDFEVNYRNHRKMIVVDGETAFIGGMNIGDEYLSMDEAIGYWRDTHTKVTGSAVPYLQSHFASDWRWAAGESLEGLRWKPQAVETAGPAATVLAIGTGPDDELERCSLMFQAAINSADERLWISTPYFAPDHAVTASLTLAAMRGVDVRILIPDEGDSLAAHYASFSYLPRMEKAGVKVYRYTKGNLHQKAVLVDAELAIVGSANFDNRSFRLNFEEVIAVWDDTGFIADFSKLLEDDFSEAYLAAGADMDEAPFHFRLKSRLFRLLAPLN
jgi:cardiolipin synthase